MYLFIHRKDLRVSDLPGLTYISQNRAPSLHLFILDEHLLGNGRYDEPSGRAFLQRLEALAQQYEYFGKTLHVLQGDVNHIIASIKQRHEIHELVYHPDTTPYARKRDMAMNDTARQLGISVRTFDDVSLVHPRAFQTFSGKPDTYKVFTPFYRKWSDYLQLHPPVVYRESIADLDIHELHDEVRMQFAANPEMYPVAEHRKLAIAADAPRKKIATFLETQVEHYKEARDFYHYDSTSRISLFLNTGAISAREVYDSAFVEQISASNAWIRQLAWRDFYLYQSAMTADYFEFEKNYDFHLLTDEHFERWANGETGIPIVDAAMRELNETGHMHNRLRMVTAMFLTKNLLCPFTLGERHFRRKLLDYDNALNRGGWLWSSSLGYDGAPYFRVMNPVTQSQRFDVQGQYLRKWLPELRHLSQEQIHLEQANAIVDLKESRQRSIDVYKVILEKAKNSAP
jgi:deoxyribodipyrimidine photo-lyase